jgi:hypothetical protein
VGLFASFLENQKSESTPANSANPANLPSHHAQNSQLSRDSQVATLKAEIAGNENSQLSQRARAKMQFWKGLSMPSPNPSKPNSKSAKAWR